VFVQRLRQTYDEAPLTEGSAMTATAEFSVSAAHSGSVVMTRVSLDEVARRAYRVIRVA
jgi:hypothetical protein